MILKTSKQSFWVLGLLFLVSCSSLHPNNKPGLLATQSGSDPQANGSGVIGPEKAKKDTQNVPADSPSSAAFEATLETLQPDIDPSNRSSSQFPIAGLFDPEVSESDTEMSATFDQTGPTDSSQDPATLESLQDTTDEELANDSTDESPNDAGTDAEAEEATYDVPIVRNESVEGYIEYFQTEIRDRFTLWLERSGRYIPLMRQIFKEHGLPEDLVFVALIESGFNPYAYSRSRAVGPWQFIKGTGRLYGLRIDSWIDERRDPIKSTYAAARYFNDLYDRFGSWPLAMAGYNAGERRIERALVRAKADDFWDLQSTRYIRRETKGYVPKFMAATIIAKNPEKYGFTLDYHEPLQFDTATVPGSADLRVIAQAAGVTYQQLKELNSELRTVLTPPYMKEYNLRLPVGTKETFEEAYSQIPDDRKIIGTRYTVRRHDTLGKIARQYGTSVSMLREVNHLRRGHILHVGDHIFIPKTHKVYRKRSHHVVASNKHRRVRTEENRKVIGNRYTVRRYDTLGKIARRYGTSVSMLREINHLERGHILHVGDHLYIRPINKNEDPLQLASLENRDKSKTPEEGDKILYMVKNGDTLWDISRSFNISIHDLKRFNGLGRRSTIRPGDQLVLGFQSKDL